MVTKTRFFGEVEIDDEKILTLDHGIMGFEDSKKWTILYDIEKGTEGVISWFQSLDFPELALPIISPYAVTDSYSPIVEDELLKPLGEFKDEDLLIFLILTIPSENPKLTTANFRAPLIINPLNKKGIQVIVNNEDYPVRYKIADALEAMKNK